MSALRAVTHVPSTQHHAVTKAIGSTPSFGKSHVPTFLKNEVLKDNLVQQINLDLESLKTPKYKKKPTGVS